MNTSISVPSQVIKPLNGFEKLNLGEMVTTTQIGKAVILEVICPLPEIDGAFPKLNVQVGDAKCLKNRDSFKEIPVVLSLADDKHLEGKKRYGYFTFTISSQDMEPETFAVNLLNNCWVDVSRVWRSAHRYSIPTGSMATAETGAIRFKHRF